MLIILSKAFRGRGPGWWIVRNALGFPNCFDYIMLRVPMTWEYGLETCHFRWYITSIKRDVWTWTPLKGWIWFQSDNYAMDVNLICPPWDFFLWKSSMAMMEFLPIKGNTQMLEKCVYFLSNYPLNVYPIILHFDLLPNNMNSIWRLTFL